MMRRICVGVLLALVIGFTLLHLWLDGSGFLMWLVHIASGVLSLIALIVALTFIIAKVPWRPLHVTAAAFAAEFFSTVKLFGFDMILGAPPLTSSQASSNPSNTNHLPILFVHGFSSNAGFWRDYLNSFKNRWCNSLATVNLEPVHTSIDTYALSLEKAIDDLLVQTNAEQCLIIAHSMGGLATRSYLEQYRDANKVKGVVTLGTPHHGTTLAALSMGANSHQMRPNSLWRKELLAHEKGVARPKFECLIGTHDNIVSPQQSAEYEYATNTYMIGVTHLAMAYDNKVIEWAYDRANRLCQ